MRSLSMMGEHQTDMNKDMAGCRVFLGGLNHRVSECDIERFFKNYTGVGDITLKNGYAFMEFDDKREADDAIYEMNGRELLGGRVTVEKANERPRDSRFQRGARRDRFGGGGRGSRSPRRYNQQNESKFRLRVTNLSRSVSWRDLKDYMRTAGDVVYADAHRQGRNEGVVDFATVADMRNAIRRLDGRELSGKCIHLIDEYGHLKRFRSASRSRSRSRARQSRSVSRSRSRSRSGTPARTQRYKNGASQSRTPSRDRSRSGSRDIRRGKSSRTPSKSPGRNSRAEDD